MVPAPTVPPPPDGSIRYFLLLYTQRARREALATLLAVADELGTGLARTLEPDVARVRLEWWQQEAERASRGVPVHPWLLALHRSGSAPLPLTALVEAAAIDLAAARTRGAGGQRLARACFGLMGELLTARPLTHPQREQLEQLGLWVQQLERLAEPDLAPPAPLDAMLIEPPLQPSLAPLLIWAALALQRARRRRRRASAQPAARQAGESPPGTSPAGDAPARKSARMDALRFDEFADNFIAWRAARRAARGQFTLAGS